MNERIEGILLKGIGGFYYVKAADALYTCRARGTFRKEGITPLVGDRVLVLPESGDTGTVVEVLPRRNSLPRPPVANVDYLVLVVSSAQPEPSAFSIDKLLCIAHRRGVEPLLVFSKMDLAACETLVKCYRLAGYRVFTFSLVDPGPEQTELEALRRALSGKAAAFSGNSGVGKSTLLNLLDPRIGRATGEISQKLGRGRHTTREVELFEQPGGGWLADTPGFASLELSRAEPMPAAELADCFPEFAQASEHCRWPGCTHIGESGCAVQKAVEEGRIAQSRYESYQVLYQELRSVHDWER